MGNFKILLALTALSGFSLSLHAQPQIPLSDFAVDGSGYPNDQINDHAAFIAAQEFFQTYYNAPGDQDARTLVLADGEYIIGKQQLHEYGDPVPPGWTTSIYPFNDDYPHCRPLVTWQEGFRLNEANDFTIQGVPPTPGVPGTGTRIRYRDCLYYGTFFRTSGTDEVFSAAQEPCLACNQEGHSSDLLHAVVGTMFTFRDCDQITIRDLELNGNLDNALLGGQSYFDGIQTSYDGIALEYVSNSLIENVKAHHFGKDGLMIWGHEDYVPDDTGLLPDPADFGMPWAATILFNNTVQNSKFNWNGRQGISWTACAGLTVNYCDMNYNGAGRVSSSLRAGLDIEGRGGPYRVRYGVFNHCNFLHNRFRGIHADTGPCLGQQDFRFNYCIVKAGTEGLAILPNSRGMKFDHCEVYGNVGPFFDQAENVLPWDPEFNVRFSHTKFFEEDEEWRYIRWPQDPIACEAGPHMFQFTPDRAGPVHFDTCEFHTNCYALVRLAGLDVTDPDKQNLLPNCTPCGQQTCVTPGPCMANCGVTESRFVQITDCKFYNTGRNHCAASNDVIAVDLATTQGAFGIEIHIPDEVRGQPTLDYTYPFGEASLGPSPWAEINCYTEPEPDNAYCDNRVVYETPYNNTYPTCRPFFELPDLLLHCGPENLPLQACVSDADCDADLIVTDGTLSSTLSSPLAGTVYIQAQFIVDQDFTFDGAEVKMGPGAEIIVQDDVQLFVFNSTIESCLGQMWKGFTANDLAVVFVVNSRIADSESGLTGLDGSILYMNQTDFANNRVAVTVPEQGQYNSVGIYAVNSTFHSEGPMAQPYPGQTSTVGAHGYAAFDVNDMTLYLTGGNNAIHHLSNGIVANQSNVYEGGSTFTDIQPDAVYADLIGNGAAINAYGDEGSWYMLKQSGPGMTSGPNFERCRWGVHTMYMSVYSTDNSMQEMGTGYRIMRSALCDVDIHNNKVHAKGNGIDLFANDGAVHILVQGNDITFGDQLCGLCVSHTGIKVAEGNYNSYNSVIRNNTLRFVGQLPSTMGIQLLAANDWLVADNQVIMQNNILNLYGVFMKGCNRAEVSCNTISSMDDSFVNIRQAAIHNFMGADPLISCNDLDWTANGILFNGTAPDTDVRGNKMRHHRWGLHLGDNMFIGVQELKGNLWYNEPASGGLGAWYEDTDNAPNNPFFYNSATIEGGNTEPPSVSPPFGWFNTDPGQNYDCAHDEGEDYCNQFQERGEKRLTALDVQVANDDLENDPYTDETKWMLKGDLYKKLDEQPELQDSLLIMAEFYTDLQDSPIADFKAIDDEQSALYAVESNLVDQMHANREQAEDLMVLVMGGLEQLADNTLSSAQRQALIESIREYQETISDLSVSNSAALQVAADAKAATAGTVQASNAAIPTSELIEENQKTVNDMHLATIGKDVDTFTPEQAAALFDVANQCPMIGGNAVFKARSLYLLIDDAYEFDDVALCLPHGIAVKNLVAFEPNAVVVVPNPTIDEATLVLTQQLEGTVIFVVYDALGAEVMRYTVPAETPRFAFSTASLPSALYHYQVRGPSSIVGVGKLTILR